MRSHLLGILESAAILQVNLHTGRAPSVTSDRRQKQKLESHERILDLAAKQIKERGLESISIDDLMKGAGLTKGAFYGHFSSRNALLLEATKRAKEIPQKLLRDIAESKKKFSLADVIDVYLSEQHINPNVS